MLIVETLGIFLIVLQIAVHGNDDTPFGFLKSRSHSGGLAEITTKDDDDHPIIGRPIIEKRRVLINTHADSACRLLQSTHQLAGVYRAAALA